MKKLIYSLLSMVAILLFTSCSQDFLDRKPISQLTDANFYQTESDALKAIMACYSTLQGPRFYGESYYYVMDLASDDITHKDQPNSIDQFLWASVGSQATRFEHLWQRYYEGVFRCNLVLEKVPSIGFSDDNRKNVILAEAKFLRGLYLWHIAHTFGNAPLVTGVAKSLEETFVPNSARTLIYRQAEIDLADAFATLPDEWDDANKGRATKWSAAALLGKVYLYQQKWAEAETQFKLVVNSGKFRLLNNFNDIFSHTNEHNEESLFEINYGYRGSWPPINGFIDDIGVGGEGSKRDLIYGIQNGEGQIGFGELIATSDFEAEIERGDARRRAFIYVITDAYGNILLDTLTGYDASGSEKLVRYTPVMARLPKTGGNEPGQFFHVKKAVRGYHGDGTPLNSTTNWRLIRYADVLLMLAEALNEQGKTGEAIPYLNQVRKRARDLSMPTYTIPGSDFVVNVLSDFPYLAVTHGLTYYDQTDPDSPTILNFTGGSQDDLRAAIVHERRVELCFEYHRFPDMRRWDEISPNHPGAATRVFSRGKPFEIPSVKPYLPNVHRLCPIPQRQIDLSRGTLVQNPGY